MTMPLKSISMKYTEMRKRLHVQKLEMFCKKYFLQYIANKTDRSQWAKNGKMVRKKAKIKICFEILSFEANCTASLKCNFSDFSHLCTYVCRVNTELSIEVSN